MPPFIWNLQPFIFATPLSPDLLTYMLENLLVKVKLQSGELASLSSSPLCSVSSENTDVYVCVLIDGGRADSGSSRRPLRAVGKRAHQVLRMYMTHAHTHTHTHTYTYSDASYTDPLGDVPQRPRTAARARPAEEDDFEGVELGDDLLPE